MSKITDANVYDMIIVGSGNGACGFLSKYLDKDDLSSKILVLEAGKAFFDTSDITHQNNWAKSYAEGKILQLHNAQTADDIPIISGWACTMGGGGSINYAMMYESSHWLSRHIGKDVAYWDKLKDELGAKLNCIDCIDPEKQNTELTQQILRTAALEGFNPPNPHHYSRGIPSYQDFPHDTSNQLYLFATPFNRFGQRTHSGVSLIDWFDKRIELKTQCQVTQLEFEENKTGESRCEAVHVKYTGKTKANSATKFLLSETGRVILCAGAATPRLLISHRTKLNNYEIGKDASDHIAIPLGIYRLKKKLHVTPEAVVEQEIPLTSKDNYMPVFATTVWQAEQDNGSENRIVCTIEFFAGNFERLWYFVSHLYLAFLLLNCIKRWMIQSPRLFDALKRIRLTIEKSNTIFNLGEETELITAIIKFNPAEEGEYLSDNNRINLNFFKTSDRDTSSNQDKEVAKKVIAERVLPLMDRLGDKPPWLIRLVLRVMRIPFEENQINTYLKCYSKNYLLSQQHMAGGCLFGKAIDKGLDAPQATGKVKGTNNVYVADLSASPLPRISPQMTAYLIGFHVATQLSET